jgi:hypothetical protein
MHVLRLTEDHKSESSEDKKQLLEISDIKLL